MSPNLNNQRPRRRPVRLNFNMFWFHFILASAAALALAGVLDRCLLAEARATPPVILPLLPDGGYCETQPPDNEHPGPDEVWSLLQEPPTDRERKYVEIVLSGCPRASRERIDPWRVLAALRFEVVLGVPERFRFLFPATLCLESAFSAQPNLLGDQGRARGPVQLHWPWAAYCRDRRTWGRTNKDWAEVMALDPRDDLAFSLRCWSSAIERVLPKAASCGSSAYEVAEAIVARAPHPLDCSGRTAHAVLAEQWRSNL